MKKFLALIALIALSSAQAAVVGTFAGTGTDIGTTNCYYVVSATGGGIPRIQYLNVTTDQTNNITFYTPSDQKNATLATNASQAKVYLDNSATTFAANDCVVFRRISDNSYQRLTVTSVTTTSVTFVQNLSASVAIGDVFYKMTSAGTIPITLTKEINANNGAIFNGVEGKPVLVDCPGTSAVQVNVCAGVFER